MENTTGVVDHPYFGSELIFTVSTNELWENSLWNVWSIPRISRLTRFVFSELSLYVILTILLFGSYTASTKIVCDIMDSSKLESSVTDNAITIVATIYATIVIFLFILI